MDISELKRQRSSDLQRHPWEIVRAGIINFLLKKYNSAPGNIADVGSGDTYVLQQLNMRGIEKRFAVDTGYDDEIVSQLKTNNTGKEIRFLRSKEDLENSRTPINLFLFLDVLEHCEDDKAVLSSYVHTSAADDRAAFLITVPAYQGLWSTHDQLLGHYRRYTRRQLEKLCKEEKLKVIRSGYFFFTLLPARWMQRMLERSGLRKPDRSIDNWNGSTVVSKLILAILWLDFYIGYGLSKAGIILPGLSCYCICQKSPS